MNGPILEMKNISKSFSGVYALKGIDFSLERGEVHALLGENGAGKSTLIKVLGGIYRPDSGSISLNGAPVEIKNVHTAREYGIGIIHQEIMLVPSIPVYRNIFLGREITKKTGILDEKAMILEAKDKLNSLEVDLDVTRRVEELTIAQQQMVEIVKAISFNAKILVMDEPTSSRGKEDVNTLFRTIERLKKQEVSIIYISHRMEELFQISDRITVIRDGHFVGTKFTQKTDTDELVSMMVGRALEKYDFRTGISLKNTQTVLDVQGLSSESFKDITFKVHKGEILGFAGLIGAGRSELMMSIFANTPHRTQGQVYLNGESVYFKKSSQAIKKGIGFVPEDRKKQGLVLSNSVGFNMVLASLDRIMRGFAIDTAKKNKLIHYYADNFKIKASSYDTDIINLSGGNQQKVVIAKWLSTDPSLLILDEPTRGVDVGAKFEIYSIINELSKAGLAIILISSDLPEVINMCDSVCVMKRGRLVKQLTKNELSQELIMKYAAGG